MDLVAEVLDAGLLPVQNDRPLVVRNLALRFGVDPDEIQVLPNGLKQLVEVPPELARDRHVVGNSVPDFQLLQTDGVDFVEDVDARHVYTVVFDGIDQLVGSGVAGESDVCVRKLVLLGNRSDLNR